MHRLIQAPNQRGSLSRDILRYLDSLDSHLHEYINNKVELAV